MGQPKSGFYGDGKNNDDSIRNFQPPMPHFAKKQLPPNPMNNQKNKSVNNNGYGMMKAPPSRAKRQAAKEKKSVWDINENSGDDSYDDEYKKNNVLGNMISGNL